MRLLDRLVTQQTERTASLFPYWIKLEIINIYKMPLCGPKEPYLILLRFEIAHIFELTVLFFEHSEIGNDSTGKLVWEKSSI